MRRTKVRSSDMLSMLGLAIRVGITTERSPVPLVPLSVTMDGLQQFQLVPKRLSPCKLFMSCTSVNTCELIRSTLLLHPHNKRNAAQMRTEEKIRHSPALCRSF